MPERGAGFTGQNHENSDVVIAWFHEYNYRQHLLINESSTDICHDAMLAFCLLSGDKAAGEPKENTLYWGSSISPNIWTYRTIRKNKDSSIDDDKEYITLARK